MVQLHHRVARRLDKGEKRLPAIIKVPISERPAKTGVAWRPGPRIGFEYWIRRRGNSPMSLSVAWWCLATNALSLFVFHPVPSRLSRKGKNGITVVDSQVCLGNKECNVECLTAWALWLNGENPSSTISYFHHVQSHIQ